MQKKFFLFKNSRFWWMICVSNCPLHLVFIPKEKKNSKSLFYSKIFVSHKNVENREEGEGRKGQKCKKEKKKAKNFLQYQKFSSVDFQFFSYFFLFLKMFVFAIFSAAVNIGNFFVLPCFVLAMKTGVA